MFRIVMGALHLLALGLGMGAVLTRGSTLREPVSADSLRRAFRADNLWAFAALLWVVTGVWRLMGGLEKAREYYLMNSIFMLKMGLFALVVALEIWPMLTLLRWRRELRGGRPAAEIAAAPKARRLAAISHIEALVLVLMIFAAVAMARGYGMS